jgi:NAD(P)-dependent dehydrogenase (short-subunit alcohol dehydrogenase family)
VKLPPASQVGIVVKDLVGAAIFFASSDSDLIIGQTLVVDGGEIKH